MANFRTTTTEFMPTIPKDFTIKAEGLKFGDEKVQTLHGGNTNQPSSIKCELEVPVGTFVRQKIK